MKFGPMPRHRKLTRGCTGSASAPRTRQSGAQIAEAAVVLPVLLFILFEIVWLCLAFSSSSTLQRAAKEGAIAASRSTCATCGNATLNNNQVFNLVNGSLQAGHKDYCWRNSREVNVSLLSAHEGDQFVVDDPDESLTRCKTTNHFLADCFFPDPRNEFLDYRQSDIRFQQRHAHFAQCILNIAFR